MSWVREIQSAAEAAVPSARVKWPAGVVSVTIDVVDGEYVDVVFVQTKPEATKVSDLAFRTRAAARKALRQHGGDDAAFLLGWGKDNREAYRAYLDEFAGMVADEAAAQGIEASAIGDGKIIELIRSVLKWIAENPDKFLALIRGIVELFMGLIPAGVESAGVESAGVESAAIGDRLPAVRDALKKIFEYFASLIGHLDLDKAMELFAEFEDLRNDFSFIKALKFLRKIGAMLPASTQSLGSPSQLKYAAAYQAVQRFK